MADEQYIAAHVSAYPAERGRLLLSNLSGGRSEILSDQLFGILRQADRFDTLAGHARTLLTAGWEDDGTGFIESALQELVARELMVPKSSFLASLLKRTDKQQAPPPVTSIVIPTRDRIPQLQRCLESWIENNRKHDRHPCYVVLDDSRQTGHGAKIAEILTPIAAAGTIILYAGTEEKTRFAGELVRAAHSDGLPEDVVAFALFGDERFAQTYGANRNALLLAASGELSVMTDDDIICQPSIPGKSTPALILSGMRDPTICRFYSDRRQLSESVSAANVDVLSCHEKLLGRSIAGCVSALGPDSALDVTHVTSESVHAFRRASRVVKATAAGSWGDSGMESPRLFLELTGESRDLLMTSEERYLKAKESREIHRSVSGYTISKGVTFATMNVGLDNRALLPPFLPVGRNEDGIFAMTLHLCVEDALVGHIPFAVLHSPLETRRYVRGPMPLAAPRLAEIISTIASTFTPSPGRTGVSERLSDLGKLFFNVGSLNAEDFRGHIESTWVSESSRYISFLEYMLDLHHGQPDYWAEDVQSFIERLIDFTVHQSPAAPRELLETQSPDQASETCRRVVRRFGELLQWWPVIDGAARRLRENGTRLVKPI